MLIFAACFAIFVYGMVASMLGTIIPALGTQFSLSNVEIGYVALAQGMGLALASVASGAMIERFGKKAGLQLGCALIISSLLAVANPTGLRMIMIAMFVLGTGGSLVIVGANALGSDVSESKRASVLNFLNVFVGLGGLATPFVAGNLMHSDPKVVAYGALAMTLGAVVVVSFTPMKAASRQVVPSSAGRSMFRNSTLYALAGIVFLYTACEFGIWNWLAKYLIMRGIPSATALTILSLGFALGLLFGRVGAAKLLTSVSPYGVCLAAAFAMAMTTYLMLHLPTPLLTGLAVFCAGLAMAPVFPTTIAIVGNLFTQGTSTAIGFVITCGFSGLVVSSPLIGWLSGPEPGGLSRGLLLLPCFSTLILVTFIAFRKRIETPPLADAATFSDV